MLRRKSVRRKSVRRKSVRRNSVKRKSVKRKSVKRKSVRRKSVRSVRRKRYIDGRINFDERATFVKKIDDYDLKVVNMHGTIETDSLFIVPKNVYILTTSNFGSSTIIGENIVVNNIIHDIINKTKTNLQHILVENQSNQIEKELSVGEYKLYEAIDIENAKSFNSAVNLFTEGDIIPNVNLTFFSNDDNSNKDIGFITRYFDYNDETQNKLFQEIFQDIVLNISSGDYVRKDNIIMISNLKKYFKVIFPDNPSIEQILEHIKQFNLPIECIDFFNADYFSNNKSKNENKINDQYRINGKEALFVSVIITLNQLKYQSIKLDEVYDLNFFIKEPISKPILIILSSCLTWKYQDQFLYNEFIKSLNSGNITGKITNIIDKNIVKMCYTSSMTNLFMHDEKYNNKKEEFRNLLSSMEKFNEMIKSNETEKMIKSHESKMIKSNETEKMIKSHESKMIKLFDLYIVEYPFSSEHIINIVNNDMNKLLKKISFSIQKNINNTFILECINGINNIDSKSAVELFKLKNFDCKTEIYDNSSGYDKRFNICELIIDKEKYNLIKSLVKAGNFIYKLNHNNKYIFELIWFYGDKNNELLKVLIDCFYMLNNENIKKIISTKIFPYDIEFLLKINHENLISIKKIVTKETIFDLFLYKFMGIIGFADGNYVLNSIDDLIKIIKIFPEIKDTKYGNFYFLDYLKTKYKYKMLNTEKITGNYCKIFISQKETFIIKCNELYAIMKENNFKESSNTDGIELTKIDIYYSNNFCG